jgi:DNA-binding LytR/AlgR family response regulator
MIRIAVCDDNKELMRKNAIKVNKYLKEMKKYPDIKLYSSAENLEYDIKAGKVYDVILMDSEMPGKSNMDIAKMVKERSVDSLIIFITSHSEYALDSYELSVFRYILKEDMDSKLLDTIRDAVKCIEQQRDRIYIINMPTRYERIPYENIFYIHRAGNNSCFITNNGKRNIKKAVFKVYSELDKKQFAYVDRGCIVNLKHVMRMENDEVVMRNGEVLIASNKRVPDLRRSLSRYWGEIEQILQ